MHIDPALFGALSALVGAIIGGAASLAAAIYTQRYQNRLQRIVREMTKREFVYADFIMSASWLLLKAYDRRSSSDFPNTIIEGSVQPLGECIDLIVKSGRRKSHPEAIAAIDARSADADL